MNLLKLENLSKYYTSQTTVTLGLNSVNLTFDVGEFVAITGESGSGKSTLSHVIAGIIPYESGELYHRGKPTSHYDSRELENYRRDEISFISQSYGILEGNTVLENVESALRFSGIAVDETHERAEAILRKVELYDHRGKRASKLSSGQKQRLSIARALAKPSKILVADEPTGNLDSENSEKIIKLLYAASEDRLVLLVTHDYPEAENYVTRHIVLKDGVIISDKNTENPPARQSGDESSVSADTKLCGSPDSQKGQTTEKKAKKAGKANKALSPYVAALSLKAHPVFTAIMCIFLAITSFITYAFLSSFMIALDDASTRIYDTSAFKNGSPERIVVMKRDKENFTSEELSAILGVRYVESIERFGYAADAKYYYIEGVDYIEKEYWEFGLSYHPIDNPGDMTLESKAEFKSSGHFLQTVPLTEKSIISEGRIPEGVYETVSADPSHKIGDKVRVYFKNSDHWSSARYFGIDLTVVGKTSHGEGLYISDSLAAAVTNKPFVLLPYEEGQFKIKSTISSEPFVSDGEFYFTSEKLKNAPAPGSVMDIKGNNGESLYLTCMGLYQSKLPNLILVSHNDFGKLISTDGDNQISLTIKDYSYTERVLSKLGKMGYMAISVFKEGAVDVDETLAVERVITLALCFVVLIFSYVLQLILAKALFTSHNRYFKSMADIGMTSKVAYRALSLELLLFMLAGQAICVGAIAVLDAAAVPLITNINKYLDFSRIMILLGTHILSIAAVLLVLLKSLKAYAFSKEKQTVDLDLGVTEEVAK